MSATQPVAGAAEASSPSTSKPPWRKILYEQQPYPDSYLPDEQWSKPVPVYPGGQSPPWLALLLVVAPLAQSMNVVFVFLLLFYRLEQGILHPATLMVGCFAGLLAATVAWRLVCSTKQSRSLEGQQGAERRVRTKGRTSARASKSDRRPSLVISFIIVLLLLYALSPVLRTLTEATANDTIYPLSFSLFVLHLCLAENTLDDPQAQRAPQPSQLSQGPPPPHAEGSKRSKNKALASASSGPLSSALSLNAAASASLVLASRLPSNLHVFVLLFLAIMAFALFPVLTSELRRGRAEETQGRSITDAAIFLSAPLALLLWSIALALPLPTTAPLFGIGIANVFVMLIVPTWLKAAGSSKVRYVAADEGDRAGKDPLWRVAKPVATTYRGRRAG